MFLSLKNNAIFVADSHFNEKNQQFLIFLENIKSKKIETSQLFLMGDMFDFLSCESKYFILKNQQAINLLNELSKTIQIVYLEGNHDYNLQKLFPNIEVIKRENQPFKVKYEDKTIALSHGDNFINWHYDLYCTIIRNKLFLTIMNLIDFNYLISKKIENALLQKSICHKMTNYKNLVEKRIKNYDSDIVVEGHYHQGETFIIDNKQYLNIPSLCCSNNYTQVNNLEFTNKNM